MGKLSKARQRGVWPEGGLVGYGARPRVEVTISMDREEYDWLAGFVRTTGHVWCVEDALNKAVSAMKGEEPMAHFADGIAWQHDIPASALLFRPHGEPTAKAVDRLYMAALFLAEVSRSGMFHFVRVDNLPPPDVIALAQAALGEDLDLQAEIERARKEWDTELADLKAEFATETRKKHDGAPGVADLSDEDDIPF